MRSVMLPKLYQHLTLNLFPDWLKLTFLESLLDPEAEGLQYVKGTAIMAQLDRVEIVGNYKSDVYEDWSHRRDRFDSTDDPGDFHGKKLFCARVLNIILRFILKVIPENKFHYFQYVDFAISRPRSARWSFLQESMLLRGYFLIMLSVDLLTVAELVSEQPPFE